MERNGSLCERFIKNDYFPTLKSKLSFLEPLKKLWKNLDVKLDQVYIPLKLKLEKEEKFADFNDWIAQKTKYPYVLIWGDPGSGKSTLIQATIVNLIEKFQDHRIIPLFAQARNWQKGQRFEDFLMSEVDSVVEGAFETILNNCEDYDLFLFLDGLDELPDGFDISTASEKFFESEITKRFSKTIVTARSRREGNRFFKDEYHVIGLESLSRDNIEALFNKWLDVIRSLGVSIQEDTVKKLQTLLVENEILSRLSSNPLLFSLSFLWFLTADVDVEQSFKTLMDEVMEKLFKTWDEIRGVKVKRRYALEKYFGAFERLALAELEGARVKIASEVQKEGEYVLDPSIAEELEKRGVFVRFEDGQFKFVNELFRDYFAARYMSRDPANYARYFALKLFDLNWRVPFKMTFYFLLGSSYEATQFLNLLLETYNPFDKILFLRLKNVIDYLVALQRNEVENASELFERISLRFQKVYSQLMKLWNPSFPQRIHDLKELTNEYDKIQKFYGEICGLLAFEKGERKRESKEVRGFRIAKLLTGRGGEPEEVVTIEIAELKELLKSLFAAKIKEEVKKDKRWQRFYREEVKIRLAREPSQDEISEIFNIASKPLDAIMDLGKKSEQEKNVREIQYLFSRVFSDRRELIPTKFMDKLIETMEFAEDTSIFKNFIEGMKLLGLRGVQLFVCLLKESVEKSVSTKLELYTRPPCKELDGLRKKWNLDEAIELLRENLSYSYSRPEAVVTFDFLFALYQQFTPQLDFDRKKRLSKILCKLIVKRRGTRGD